MTRMNWMWAAALAGLMACGGEEGERVDLGAQRNGQQERTDARANWSPELRLLVDSANTAYAAGDYQEAADIFRGITEDQPELGVAWFGLSMAERAMGNDEAADAALAESEARAPGLGRMHEAAADSAQRSPGMQGMPGMPEGHPILPRDQHGMPPGHPPVDGGTDTGTGAGAETSLDG